MDTKKKEIIIKLIRLANNNPNENEANLAARKVCKMLSDFNFNSAPTQQTQNSRDADFYTIFNEMRRKAKEAEERNRQEKERQSRTWNDVNRSNEPFWRSTYSGVDWGRQNVNIPYDYAPKTGKPKQSRVCDKCKTSVVTIDTKNPFYCAKCKWDHYGNPNPEAKINICCECGKESFVATTDLYFVCDSCLNKRHGKGAWVRSDLF